MVKEVKQAKSNAVEFTKHLSGVVVAFSLLGLGVFAVWEGRYNTHLAVYAAALIFAGAVNVVASLVVLYRVLMHKEA